MIDIQPISEFFRNIVEQAAKDGIVIGLSGGIDSTVTAYLAAQALSPAQVHGLCLPYSTQSYDLGYKIKDLLQIPVQVINIAHMVNSLVQAYPELFDTRLQLGNLHARARMCILYAYAAKHNLLVAGTTNRSEYEIGYLTKYGDGAVDFEPICHVYKTEVYTLAESLNIPQEYISQKPSAGLWKGQTDEGELGFNYDVLDFYLQGETEGISSETQDRIKSLIKSAKHKQQMPPSLLD